jgi:anti-sigma B factor antagonist
MELQEKTVGEVDVLVLNGRLDASCAKEVKDKVRELTKQHRVKLVIDMAGVDFIDSSGLGSLVASLRSVNKNGGEIKVAALQDQVRAIFELTRLHRIFDIFDNFEDAAKSF